MIVTLWAFRREALLSSDPCMESPLFKGTLIASSGNGQLAHAKGSTSNDVGKAQPVESSVFFIRPLRPSDASRAIVPGNVRPIADPILG